MTRWAQAIDAAYREVARNQFEMARASAERFGRKCIDCGDPAWDTALMLCRWCYRWRLIDLRAARVS